MARKNIEKDALTVNAEKAMAEGRHPDSVRGLAYSADLQEL